MNKYELVNMACLIGMTACVLAITVCIIHVAFL